jgi:hypothetical protein
VDAADVDYPWTEKQARLKEHLIAWATKLLTNNGYHVTPRKEAHERARDVT